MKQNTGSSLLFKMLVLCALCLSFQQPAHTQSTAPPSAPASIQVEPLAVMPSWFADGRPTEDAWLALDVLVNAASQGLNPNDYRAQELTLAFEFKHEQQTGPVPDEQARMDAALTAALELYLSDLNNGRLSPSELKQRFKAPADSRFDAHRYLAQARQSGDLAQALKNAQPKVPMYEAVRSAMGTYRGLGSQPAWKKPLPPLPTRSLKPDDAWEGLPLLAQRLAVLGDLPPDTPPAERYNEVLADAVKRFQARHGLDTDGVIGPATLAQLNLSPAQRVEQMALTLERLRWTPLLHGPRMIVVNIPEFVLRAYENKGPQIKLDLEMRVVVGRALDTRTPIFLEDMRFIEFSPYWNIPRSITRNETLPRLRRGATSAMVAFALNIRWSRP